MARPVVLSNGELHVGLNNWGLVHDFYFPYVGFENHAAGKNLRHKIGIWVDGRIHWLDSENSGWEFRFAYPEHVLVGVTTARNENIGVELVFTDFVDTDVSAFVRSIKVTNLRSEERNIRLFMHQAFAIGDSRSNTDTAQYLPDNNAILHYRGRRAFVVSGQDSSGVPFDQYTIGLFGIEGREGTYRDADDGDLSFSNVEHGRVDSTLRFAADIAGESSTTFDYWIAAGTSTREALYVHSKLLQDGVEARLTNVKRWWNKWLEPTHIAAEKIREEHRDDFIKSVMIMKSQIDKRGAIIASTDTTMLNYSRDAYAYSWPRDGAYVLWPLIRIGYKDEAIRFFEFCKQGLHPDGYLMHKYRADGALGSSWHPYVHEGESAPPIQEDETALVLFVFAQFYTMNEDSVKLKDFYDTMIVPMADFMTRYIDKTTGLTKQSYGLWEEIYSVHTYTVATTHAALLAAVDLAEKAEDGDNAVKWKSAADDLQVAAHKYLYNADKKAFYENVDIKNGEVVYRDTLGLSAFFGSFMFGLFPTDGEEIINTAETIKETFHFKPGINGLPRYNNDYYFRASEETPGNWWFVTTLWFAQYYLEIGQKDEAEKIIHWVKSYALDTGVLSEQVNPIDNSLISVAPLTWSHAEFVATLLDTIDKS